MEAEALHQAIRRERLTLADLLDALTPAEWETPSLCPGWTVRDVAAHAAAAERSSLRSVLVEMVLARGDFNRMIRDEARRHAAAQAPAELVAQLRSAADSRRRAPGTSPVEPLLDVLVHGQDVAIPLGRERVMPLDAARVAAQRVWDMGFPFGARKRLRGLRLVATDVDWAVGEGAQVRGPVQALLLLVTGRSAALPHLQGPALAELRTRLPAGR